MLGSVQFNLGMKLLVIGIMYNLDKLFKIIKEDGIDSMELDSRG